MAHAARHDAQAGLGLKPATRMLLTTEAGGSVRLRSYRAVAHHNRGMLSRIAPAGAALVDELLVERRNEAAREGRE